MRSAAGPRGSGVFAGYLDAWGRKGLVWTGRARRLDASVKRTDGFPRQIVAARIFETRSELCFMWGVRCLIVFFTDQRLRPRPGKRDTLTYGALKPLVCAGLSSGVRCPPRRAPPAEDLHRREPPVRAAMPAVARGYFFEAIEATRLPASTPGPWTRAYAGQLDALIACSMQNSLFREIVMTPFDFWPVAG